MRAIGKAINLHHMALFRSAKGFGRAVLKGFTNPEVSEAERKFIEENEFLADQAVTRIMDFSTTDEKRLGYLGVFWAYVFMIPKGSNPSAARQTEAAMLLSRCRSAGVDLERSESVEDILFGLPEFERGFYEAVEDGIRRFRETELAD